MYMRKNNNADALYHYKEFIALRDSIYNIEKTKEITRKELEFDFSKKEQVQKIEQEKQLSIAEQENLDKLHVTVPVSDNGEVETAGALAAFIREARRRKIEVWAVVGDASRLG